MQTIISISELSKTYMAASPRQAQVSLDIRRGEIFALLRTQWRRQTTLISIVSAWCTQYRTGDGRWRDIIDDYRCGAMIGLVPQELTTDAFESVWNTVSFSRGLFGKPARPGYRTAAQGPVAVGQEGRQADDVVRRHEASGIDRQGLVARAAHPVPR